MSAEAQLGAAVPGPRSRGRKFFILSVAFFVIAMVVALLMCRFRVEYATQDILARQQAIQQAWLDKSLDAIRVWRNELAEQARFISASEMFRLFVMDARELDAATLCRIAEPDSLNCDDETIRSLAEQLTYMQDLLRDFTRRRAWSDARILRADGASLVAPDFAAPLTPAQTALVNRARDGRSTFGPIRRTDAGLVMDMADPLFEVLGAQDPQTVAVLLLSVPLDKPLAGFLARTGEHEETLLPRIVDQGPDGLVMAVARMGNVTLEPVVSGMKSLENLPFMRRAALDGTGEVYSLGARPTVLDWRYVLETPAAEVDALIKAQKVQIYGLGVLGSVGVALLAAFIWAAVTSRANEARARHLEVLYTTIRNQKLLLDGVNASLKPGLVLVDSQGRVQWANPAFCALAGAQGEIAQGTPLVEVLPGKAAVRLLSDMAVVNDCGHAACEEVSMPAPGGSGTDDPSGTEGDDGSGIGTGQRLFRVTLYPYESGEGELAATGCVATFQDITQFRRAAMRARQRQAALVTALVRAIEGVDPNLAGHSDRMADMADRVASELNLDERECETLGLAARLSQIGKIFIPRELLAKRGALTPEERQEVLRAPEYADRILHDLRFDLPVRETVREMGERMDGSGAPQGLRGEEISRAGRVLAVVNAFVAMTSPRPWRGDSGMPPDEAVRQLMRDLRFDQDAVAALARVTGVKIAGAQPVQPENGHAGAPGAQNPAAGQSDAAPQTR